MDLDHAGLAGAAVTACNSASRLVLLSGPLIDGNEAGSVPSVAGPCGLPSSASPGAPLSFGVEAADVSVSSWFRSAANVLDAWSEPLASTTDEGSDEVEGSEVDAAPSASSGSLLSVDGDAVAVTRM